jgi:Ca2+-dependent lipid-binding protein
MEREFQDRLDKAEITFRGNYAKTLEEKDQLIQSLKAQISTQVTGLETDLMEKKYQIQDMQTRTETAEKKAQDITARYEATMEKLSKLQEEFNTLQDRISHQDEENAELISFKSKNANIVKNMEGLTQLFEEEPLFKAFNLVRDVGSMDINVLKSALGVPSVTANKYIQKFIKVGLFEEDGTKISLKFKIEK